MRVTHIYRRITRILFLYFFLCFPGRLFDGSRTELGICRNGLERSRTCFHTGSVGYMLVLLYAVRRFRFKNLYFYTFRVYFCKNILLWECFLRKYNTIRDISSSYLCSFFHYYIAISAGYYSIVIFHIRNIT